VKRKYALGSVAFMLLATGCNMNVDSGPTQTATDQIDVGKAEAVTAEIHMSAGTLHIEGGGTALVSANYRYSERVGRPSVRYDVTGAHGQLTVESPKSGSTSGSHTVNEWDLRMGSTAPLEMNVSMGAGESNLDMSQLPLRSMEVNMGAGEMVLNVAGKYTRDVTVQVNGGVGEARIRLPKDMGAVVVATGGLGSVSTNGLTKRDGKYYNDAYTEGKPAVRMEVHGGVGDVIFSVGN
jgi:N-terminal domain of toast_rack, DUF2154